MSWLSKLSGGGREKATSSAAAAADRPKTAPTIVIDRHEYQPEEFILGSFRIRPYGGDLIAKQQFDFRIMFQQGGETVDFACRGQVMRCNAETGLVARFQMPQPFFQKKLVEYLRNWKGL